MSRPFLSVRRVDRRLWNGAVEALEFGDGVNVLVGSPNTGKTKWLQTLDFLLGDSGGNPFENSSDPTLADKYDAASTSLLIGEEEFVIERRWKEVGAKTKVFVNGTGTTPSDFQSWLLDKLKIPSLHFPKGNPTSGQTWPQLSFRMLLRHIYRQQRFWSDLADQQPSMEQRACILQFLGLAERLFTPEYGQLVELKMKVERLKARREQYGLTLNELAGNLLTESGFDATVTEAGVQRAEANLGAEVATLQEKRIDLLSDAKDKSISPDQRHHTDQLAERRASLIASLESLRQRLASATERADELRLYTADLTEELDRMARAEDAGSALADLHITHCPACDQPVTDAQFEPGHCFLCHQLQPSETDTGERGETRLQFERDRLTGELKEAQVLLQTLDVDVTKTRKAITAREEQLRLTENQLAPARKAVSAFVQSEVSAIDMMLGQLNERQRQLGRLHGALGIGTELTSQIREIEKEIEPLQEAVDEAVSAMDFKAAESMLSDGINGYLTAIERLRPGSWRHSPVTVDLSRYSFNIRVGSKRWDAALGGTDSLFFLMAYHYGLLTLSVQSECHYPGTAIIDLPGEFAGEAVEDKENFIVQPFIDLLGNGQFAGAQAIVTGAAFTGLQNAHRQTLNEIYVA
jgi:transcriptional regulator with XRE-family HTH domain